MGLHMIYACDVDHFVAIVSLNGLRVGAWLALTVLSMCAFHCVSLDFDP